MSKRSASVALMLALSLAVVTGPLAASERDDDQEARSGTIPSDFETLRAETPTTIQAADRTLGRVRLHPGRDAIEVGTTAATVERQAAQ